MITVTYAEGDKDISLSVEGHAGYAQGEDIVCSAVSILVQTLLAYLIAEDLKPSYTLKKGDTHIFAEGDKAHTAFLVIMTGLKLMEDTFPDHIRLVRGCCMQMKP